MKTRLIRACDKLLVAPCALLARALRRQRPAEAGPHPEVVAIKLVGMGDAVLMLPALAAIGAGGGRLTVLTTRRCAGIFTAPGVTPGIVLLGPRPASWLAAWRALRRARLVLDFEQHVFWSAALAQAAPAAARRVGFRVSSRRRNRLYDTLVAPAGTAGEILHMKDIFDDLARAAGFAPAPALVPLPLGAEAHARAAAWRARHQLAPGSYLLFVPGSGATVQFRRLPAAIWAAVAEAFSERPVVLVGTRLEAALCREIAGLVPRAIVAPEFSLQELAAVMADAATVVAIDSGPMHLAAATGVPVVGVFGPDTPQRYGPRQPPSVSVWRALPCSPCNNCWGYREARCTNPDRFACMTGMTADDIVRPLAAILRQRAAGHAG